MQGRLSAVLSRFPVTRTGKSAGSCCSSSCRQPRGRREGREGREGRKGREGGSPSAPSLAQLRSGSCPGVSVDVEILAGQPIQVDAHPCPHWTLAAGDVRAVVHLPLSH